MDFAVLVPYLPQLALGLGRTTLIAAFAIATSLAAAALLTWGRMRGSAAIRRTIKVYTQLVLGLPILTLLYVVYFVLPSAGIRIDAFWAGILTLTLYYSPYMAEAVRGAILSIPHGQLQAGRMAGLAEGTILWRIVLPQAAGVALPALAGIAIGLTKDTAILSVISVQEFAYATKQVVSRTYAPFETWLAVAAAYWVLLSILDLGVRTLERRVNYYRPVRGVGR